MTRENIVPGSNQPRDWKTYKYKQANRLIHGGITQDLEARERELQQRWPGGHIQQVGNAKTKDGALKWEQENGFGPDQHPRGRGTKKT